MVSGSSSHFYGDSRDQIQVMLSWQVHLPAKLGCQPKAAFGNKILAQLLFLSPDLPSGDFYRTRITVPQLFSPNLILASNSQSSPSGPLRISHGWQPEPAGQLPRALKTKLQEVLLTSKCPVTPCTQHQGPVAHLLSSCPPVLSSCPVLSFH